MNKLNKIIKLGFLIISMLILVGCASKNKSSTGYRKFVTQSTKRNKPAKQAVKAKDPVDELVDEFLRSRIDGSTPQGKMLKEMLGISEKKSEEGKGQAAEKTERGEARLSDGEKKDTFCEGYLAGLRRAVADMHILDGVSVRAQK